LIVGLMLDCDRAVALSADLSVYEHTYHCSMASCGCFSERTI
jgi:hypothetical protein